MKELTVSEFFSISNEDLPEQVVIILDTKRSKPIDKEQLIAYKANNPPTDIPLFANDQKIQFVNWIINKPENTDLIANINKTNSIKFKEVDKISDIVSQGEKPKSSIWLDEQEAKLYAEMYKMIDEDMEVIRKSRKGLLANITDDVNIYKSLTDFTKKQFMEWAESVWNSSTVNTKLISNEELTNKDLNQGDNNVPGIGNKPFTINLPPTKDWDKPVKIEQGDKLQKLKFFTDDATYYTEKINEYFNHKINNKTIENFIGVKQVKAEQLTFGEYNLSKGWAIKPDEDPTREGYIVIYEDGYRSWSPKEIFEKAYKQVDAGCMTFGLAIEAAKLGKKVARLGWNGSNMYAYIVPANGYPALTEIAKKEFGDNVPYRAYWALKTAQNDVTTWAPSNSDSLAEDWIIIE